MYVANTAILNLRIFSGKYHFRLWVFASTGEYFTIDTAEYYPRCYKVNDVKTSKNLVYHFKLCSHKSSYVYCRLARLTRAF